MTRAMEHCDDTVMEHCDDKNSGALYSLCRYPPPGRRPSPLRWPPPGGRRRAGREKAEGRGLWLRSGRGTRREEDAEHSWRRSGAAGGDWDLMWNVITGSCGFAIQWTDPVKIATL